MTEALIEEENKEIAKQYKELLKISYRTLSAADKKLIRSAFDVAKRTLSLNGTANSTVA